MNSKGTLTMFDTSLRNSPLNILTPMRSLCLQYVTGGAV